MEKGWAPRLQQWLPTSIDIKDHHIPLLGPSNAMRVMLKIEPITVVSRSQYVKLVDAYEK
jgi:hypothetical protein